MRLRRFGRLELPDEFGELCWLGKPFTIRPCMGYLKKDPQTSWSWVLMTNCFVVDPGLGSLRWSLTGPCAGSACRDSGSASCSSSSSSFFFSLLLFLSSLFFLLLLVLLLLLLFSSVSLLLLRSTSQATSRSLSSAHEVPEGLLRRRHSVRRLSHLPKGSQCQRSGKGGGY